MGAATGSAAGSLGPVSGKGLGRFIAGGLALLFGLATLVEGGQVLCSSSETRAEAGQVVPLVLAFNFAAGCFCLATGGWRASWRSPPSSAAWRSACTSWAAASSGTARSSP